MPRPPNYRFERQEREKAKAAKKEAKADAKRSTPVADDQSQTANTKVDDAEE